jgi:CheY-like chemotaxis protein
VAAKPLVLVVEDDATLRFLAEKQFASVGVECHAACNGQQAIEMALRGYDLILMDLSMPEMNGMEATSHIRERELREGKSRTPIIGLTAFSEREKCIAAGMDAFIQKPLLLDQLRDLVKRYLNHHTS